MKLSRILGVAGLGLALVISGAARTRRPCNSKARTFAAAHVLKAVNTILATVDGVKGTCDQKGKTVTITAPDAATAQKAIDALAAGGFHGDTGSKDVTVKEDSGARRARSRPLR